MEKIVKEHAIYNEAEKVWLSDSEKYEYMEFQLGVGFTLKMFLNWMGY